MTCRRCKGPILNRVGPNVKFCNACRQLAKAAKTLAKPAPKPKPVYQRVKGPAVVELADGSIRFMALAEARKQAGRMAGGVACQAKGTGHRWTAETAKRAVAAREAKRGRDTGRGYRIGQRFVKRPPIARAPLREKHATETIRGVQYDPETREWRVSDEFGTRRVQETTALRKLGYLPRETDSLKPVVIRPPQHLR